jgi:hypothetical protein
MLSLFLAAPILASGFMVLMPIIEAWAVTLLQRVDTSPLLFVIIVGNTAQ